MTAGPGQGHWQAMTLASVGTHGECEGQVLGPTHGGRRESWVRELGGLQTLLSQNSAVCEGGNPVAPRRPQSSQGTAPRSCLLPCPQTDGMLPGGRSRLPQPSLKVGCEVG